MTGYLDALVQRARAGSAAIAPRIPALFEPQDYDQSLGSDGETQEDADPQELAQPPATPERPKPVRATPPISAEEARPVPHSDPKDLDPLRSPTQVPKPRPVPPIAHPQPTDQETGPPTETNRPLQDQPAAVHPVKVAEEQPNGPEPVLPKPKLDTTQGPAPDEPPRFRIEPTHAPTTRTDAEAPAAPHEPASNPPAVSHAPPQQERPSAPLTPPISPQEPPQYQQVEPIAAAPEVPAAPTVRISIGRIEVVAAEVDPFEFLPAQAPQAPAATPGVPSLSEYLEARDRGTRRT